MTEQDLIKLRPIGWLKLNRKCEKCKKDHADIEMSFSCKDLPKNYLQSGEFTAAWHMECLPEKFKALQAMDEKRMLEATMTPP